MAEGTRDIEPGTVVAGYRIEGVLGRGGMGVVYRAFQLALERPVALKLVAAELARDPGFRARFRRESLIAARIEHPNVVPVYEAGEDAERLFITMRLVPGADLGELVAGAGPLPAERAAAIVAQVAAALDAAHARGLVHRDVKPANVLLHEEGSGDHVYLTDFGLAKDVAGESGMTATGTFVGTLDYIAPEQLSGDRVDARADVYALGGVLHQLLTGAVPFPRDGAPAKMYAHLNAEPPAPSSVRPGVPAAFDAVVARAMAKDPRARFPSAGDLGRAAQAAAAGSEPPATQGSVAVGDAAFTEAAPTAAAATVDGRETRVRERPSGARRLVLAAAALLIVVIGIAAAVSLSGPDPKTTALTARTVAPPRGLGLPSCTPEFRVTGHGRCRDGDGTIDTFVDRDETLAMRTLTARILGIRRAKTLRAGGLSAEADGTFVVIKLRVENRTDREVKFEPPGLAQQQTQLVIAAKQGHYGREDLAAAAALPRGLAGTKILAGGVADGDLVYDVPNRLAKRLGDRGSGLVLFDFGVEFTAKEHDFGGIRLSR